MSEFPKVEVLQSGLERDIHMKLEESLVSGVSSIIVRVTGKSRRYIAFAFEKLNRTILSSEWYHLMMHRLSDQFPDILRDFPISALHII